MSITLGGTGFGSSKAQQESGWPVSMEANFTAEGNASFAGEQAANLPTAKINISLTEKATFR